MSKSALHLVEKEVMDKTKALDAALAQIERSFGKGSIMKLGQEQAVEIDAVSTGALGLDIALGIGGLPRGRVGEIYGPESSGKTTLALHAAASAQKLGGICAFVDAEHALDPAYAAKLGVEVAPGREQPADLPRVLRPGYFVYPVSAKCRAVQLAIRLKNPEECSARCNCAVA